MDTCPPCRTLSILIQSWGDTTIPLENVNVRQNTELARKYNIRAVPVLIKVDDNGNELQRIRGVKVKEIKQMLYGEI